MPQPEEVYLGRWAKTADAGEEETETILDAINACLNYSDWYGLIVADEVISGSDVLDADDVVSVAAIIEAATPSRIFGVTSGDAGIISTTVTTDVASRLKSGRYGRTFLQYSISSPYAAASAFGRAFTVNFNASNTTITLKFKQEPTVTYETLNIAQASAVDAKNANVFVYYANDTAILQQGVMANGDFFDERHGLDWRRAVDGSVSQQRSGCAWRLEWGSDRSTLFRRYANQRLLRLCAAAFCSGSGR